MRHSEIIDLNKEVPCLPFLTLVGILQSAIRSIVDKEFRYSLSFFE